MIIGFASYADDNTLYKASEKADAVAKTLGMSAGKLFKWFKDQMKGNVHRFHLRLSTR